MAAPTIAIDEFINLLKPGQLGDIGFILQNALSNLTTTAMTRVVQADIRALGPLVIAIRTAGIAPGITGGAQSISPALFAAIRSVTDQYTTLPTALTAYTTQVAPLPPSGAISTQTISASIHVPYRTVILFLKKTIDDFGSSFLMNVVRLCELRGASTVTPLTAVIISYVNFLSGIVNAFKFTSADLDPNYDRIIANIEKTISKMGLTIRSPGTILLSDLHRLTQPLPPVVAKVFIPPSPPPAVTPNGVSPDGSLQLDSDAGFDIYGHYSSQFPTTTQIICEDRNAVSRVANISIFPEAGWAVTGQYIQPGTKLVSAKSCDLAGNPYVKGILITVDKPMIGLKGQGDQGSAFRYKFTPPAGSAAQISAAAAFIPSQKLYENDIRIASGSHAAAIAQYNHLQSGAIASLPRPTPDGPLIEVTKSINTILTAMITRRTLTALNSRATIAAIKELPNIFGGLVNYILSNSTFLITIGNQETFVREYFAPLFPIPAATQNLYNTLTVTNFESNLTQANTGILRVLVSKYTTDFSSNLFQKIVNKANSTLSSDAQKIAGASIISKILINYIEFLNSIINIFKINLGADIAINPHITILNSILMNTGVQILSAPVVRGGRRTRISRDRVKLRRKHKTKRERRLTRRNGVTSHR